jgi:hypothetical protein
MPDLPSVLSAEPVSVAGRERIRVRLSNGCTAHLPREEAAPLSQDPDAARRFLRRWANPKGAR